MKQGVTKWILNENFLSFSYERRKEENILESCYYYLGFKDSSSKLFVIGDRIIIDSNDRVKLDKIIFSAYMEI